MFISKPKSRFLSKRALIFLFITIIMLISIRARFNDQTNFGRAHSALATPTEIFSLWNDTAPIIDGSIDFTALDLSREWSSAGVYAMYDDTNSPTGKLLLQNDDTNLYIGMDMNDYLVEAPVTSWGCAVYLDRDHNGILSYDDITIRLYVNSTKEYVIYEQYNEMNKAWGYVDDVDPGQTMSGIGVIIDTDFTSSYFEAANHRQYELKIPLSTLKCNPGNVTGVGLEAFDDFHIGTLDGTITWPGYPQNPAQIFNSASGWGDLCLGINSTKNDFYAQYAIEENFNIKTDATGYNNGTFIASADIDGDSDLELVVSSNRTVSGDTNLLAIFDEDNGEIISLWNSTDYPTHQSKLFIVTGIVAFDHDGDGEDELYLCGNDTDILRFTDWNSINDNFDTSEVLYSHTVNLSGAIDIGDVDNVDNVDLVVGTTDGEILTFAHDGTDFASSPSDTIDPTSVSTTPNCHSVDVVKIADMDGDSNNELLFNYRTTTTSDTTRLHVFEYFDPFGWEENGDDNLPSAGTANTEDSHGHTIIVGDVDNDNDNETIIVGRNYLRVFGTSTFVAGAPIELLINDGTSKPLMGGGAMIGDINDDSKKELIFGCNNGTVIIINVTDAGSDVLSYTTEWFSDLGSSPGMRNSMLCYDIDADGENEGIFGDNFGQIISIGKTVAPSITIDNPTHGSTKTTTIVQIDWTAADDVAIHHFDINVNTSLEARIGGSQIGIILNLTEGFNNIEVVAVDVTGKETNDTVSVIVSLDAPEVTILSPPTGTITNSDSITITYEQYDKNGNFKEFYIYVNGSHTQTLTDTTYNVPLLSGDGIYEIIVIGNDTDDNTGQDTLFIEKDTVNPTITIDSPTDGSAVNDANILLEWTADDSRTGIDYFEIRRDGILNGTTTADSGIVILASDIDYDLSVTAYDVAGNSATDTITVTRDIKNPMVNITSPATDLMTTQTTVTVLWDTSDNIGGTGIDHTNVTVNGVSEYTGTSTQASIDLGADGIKDVVVTTFDEAGNIAQDAIIIIKDSNNPFIEITSPVDKFNTSLDTVTICWDSSDSGSGISYYEVFVDSVYSHNITDGSVTSTVVSLAAGEKDYLVTVKAFDYLNHEFEDSITVTYNLTAKNMIITNPVANYSYSSDIQVTLNWITSNLVNHSRFDIFLDGVFVITLSNTTLTYNLDLALLTTAQNITIVAVTTSPDVNYSATRWITLDQSAPIVLITGPANNSYVYTNLIYLDWTGSDSSSGISYYNVKVDSEIIGTWSAARTSQYLAFNDSYGNVTITVEAFDFADNTNDSYIILQIYVLLPEYSIDLPASYYDADGIFAFNLSITNARLGIAEIIVLVDGLELHHLMYYDGIMYNPFIILVDINETEYDADPGVHQITVAILDALGRQTSSQYSFTIDSEAPTFVGISTIGDNALDTASTEPLAIEIDSSNLNSNLTVTTRVSDNLGITSVTLRLLGDDFDQTYTMVIEEVGAQSTLYSLILNVTDFGLGDYTITMTVTDYAGNTVEQTFSISIVEITVVPWILQGNNLIYVSAGSATALVLIVVLAVSIRKITVNMGWKKEIIIVAYVLNGLPCVYMVNNPEMVQDEMLFGGAMTGIRGVLEEIIGEKSKMEIQSVEMGQKRVLICPGNFGDSVLMVNDVKPIHKAKLISFTKTFETHYNDVLVDDPLLTPDTFRGASILVESHFGISDKMQLVDDCEFEEVSMTESPNPYEPVEAFTETEEQPATDYQEPEPIAEPEATQQPVEVVTETQPEPVVEPEPEIVVSIEEMIAQMSDKDQKTFVETIQLTQNAITALLEKNFAETTKTNNSILEKLEKLLSSKDMPKSSEGVLRTLVTITQEIFGTLEIGKSGDDQSFKAAAEKVSNIWLKEIGEKW